MSDIFSNHKLRSKSAHPRNFKNAELHACLDQAKGYKDQVQHHLMVSQFQNHVLRSAERFYKKQEVMRPCSSQTSFTRRAKLNSRSRSQSKGDGLSTGFEITNANKSRVNPESIIMNRLEDRTFRIAEFKAGYREGEQEKEYLKSRIEYLKRRIVEEKNQKARIAIKNGKWMNAAQQSQFNINNLMERSRRNQIRVQQIHSEVTELEHQQNKFYKQNTKIRHQIEDNNNEVDDLTTMVATLRRQVDRQRKLVEMWKERQAVEYKQMTNKYMVMNQLKEQKALLLNSIDQDYKKSYI